MVGYVMCQKNSNSLHQILNPQSCLPQISSQPISSSRLSLTQQVLLLTLILCLQDFNILSLTLDGKAGATHLKHLLFSSLGQALEEPEGPFISMTHPISLKEKIKISNVLLNFCKFQAALTLLDAFLHCDKLEEGCLRSAELDRSKQNSSLVSLRRGIVLVRACQSSVTTRVFCLELTAVCLPQNQLVQVFQ